MAKGTGKGRGDLMCVIWGIVWFIVLLFLAWPIAFFIAWLYVLLQPFAVCINFIRDLNEVVFKLLTLPTLVTQKMMRGERL